MKYRVLGKDLTVSNLGLGCMGMSHVYGAPSDKQEMSRLLGQTVELGIGFVAFSPLANGFLSGRYDQNSKFEPGTDYQGAMPQFTPQAMEQNRALLELVRDTARTHNATPPKSL